MSRCVPIYRAEVIRGGREMSTPIDRPEDIDMKYATGQIDREEYLRRLNAVPQEGIAEPAPSPRRRNRLVAAVIAVGIILVVASIVVAAIVLPSFLNNSNLSVTLSPPEQLSQASLNSLNMSAGSAAAFAQNNTIWVGGDQAQIVVLASPPGHDQVFLMMNLTDPTIHLARGSTLVLTVINPDPDTYHNLAITTRGPPYNQMPMMQMMNAPGTMMLPPAANETFSAQQMQVAAQAPGQYWYLCQYPGHAVERMYGNLIIS